LSVAVWVMALNSRSPETPLLTVRPHFRF